MCTSRAEATPGWPDIRKRSSSGKSWVKTGEVVDLFQVGISIGGGIGPFRANVGTRGFGGGVGPVSGGTAWGSGSSAGAVGILFVSLAVSAVLLLALLVAAWPYLIGVRLARGLGADDGIGVATVVGAGLEVTYLVALALGLRTWSDRRRDDAALAATRVDLEQRQAVLQRGLPQQRRDLAIAERLLQQMAATDVGLAPSIGASGWNLSPGEHVFGSGRRSVSVPRMVAASGSPVQTDLGEGEYLATNNAIYFRSETQHERWPVRRVQRLVYTTTGQGGRRVLFELSGRSTVSGLSFDPGLRADAATASIEWACSWPQPIEGTLDKLRARVVAATEAIVRAEREAMVVEEHLRELDDVR
jgi:hypothetical protein